MARRTVYPPGTVEPGWTTTEFYQTVFVHVIAGVIAIVTLAKTGFSPDGVQAAVPAVALAASAIAQAAYSVSRSRVKGSAATSVASSVTAPVPAVSGTTPATGATAERPRTPGDPVPPLPSVTLTFSGLALPQLAGQEPGAQNAGTAGQREAFIWPVLAAPFRGCDAGETPVTRNFGGRSVTVMVP